MRGKVLQSLQIDFLNTFFFLVIVKAISNNVDKKQNRTDYSVEVYKNVCYFSLW